MEKVNVVISDSLAATQFLALPPTYIYKDKIWCINFHGNKETPTSLVSGSKIQVSHDLLIDIRYSEDIRENYFCKYTRAWRIFRLNKLHQQVFLSTNKYLSEEDINYRDLAVSEINTLGPKIRFGSVDPQGFVIKPVAGARSLGVIISRGGVNVREFIDALNKVRKNPKPTNKDFIDVVKSYSAEIIIGEERTPNDMAETLKRQELMIQKLNPNPTVIEFRALLGTIGDADANILMFIRNHLHNDNVNVTDTIIDPANHDKYLDSKTYADIREFLCEGMRGFFGSMDLWYSPESRQWGIYEFQPQYGHIHVPDNEHTEFLMGVVHDAYIELTKVMAKAAGVNT